MAHTHFRYLSQGTIALRDPVGCILQRQVLHLNIELGSQKVILGQCIALQIAMQCAVFQFREIQYNKLQLMHCILIY